MALHLIVTDSGIGGLSACAAIERALRESHVGGPARITYVNAWPSEDGGYNDMPDLRAEAAVFERALNAMAALQPDEIIIACNTLSIVYEHTDFRRRGQAAVVGIVDAGVELFFEALAAAPDSRIALFGTKTTIESGVHRKRLITKGVSPARIIAVDCHGLAKSIETEMDGPSTMALMDECVGRGAFLAGGAGAGSLFLGVCCTHYTYLQDEMGTALQRYAGVDVEVLDPTDRLVSKVVASRALGKTAAGSLALTVSVISKVKMPEEKRRVIAARLASVSPATAQALLSYAHVPDFF